MTKTITTGHARIFMQINDLTFEEEGNPEEVCRNFKKFLDEAIGVEGAKVGSSPAQVTSLTHKRRVVRRSK